MRTRGEFIKFVGVFFDMARLSRAPDGFGLDVGNNIVVSTIDEMIDALEKMSDEDFSYLVTETKNVPADWIERALQDKFLASTCRKTKKREELKKILFIATFR